MASLTQRLDVRELSEVCDTTPHSWRRYILLFPLFFEVFIQRRTKEKSTTSSSPQTIVGIEEEIATVM